MAAPDAALLATAKRQLRAHVAQLIAEKRWRAEPQSPDERAALREQLAGVADRAWRPHRASLPPAVRTQAIEELLDEITGLGPLEPLFKDPAISEILVNGPEEVYVERHGQLERLATTFESREQLTYFIERILSPIGRRITEAEPFVDARLPDGSRVNVVIAPMALTGPYLSIRRFSKDVLTIEDLVRQGTVTRPIAAFLSACVLARCNIILSGASGAGKTTTLNALAHVMPAHERVVVMEDIAELQFRDHHVVRMETRPPSLSGLAEVTMRDLLKNALHMRPDRIIVGEVRGAEALEMLQAMNTGHDGCMATLHANTPHDVIARIETMALMTQLELSGEAIRRQVVSALDLVVHLERFPDGSRHIVSISEVAKGPRGEVSGEPLHELFAYHHAATADRAVSAGQLVATGARPQSSLLRRLERAKAALPDHVFEL